MRKRNGPLFLRFYIKNELGLIKKKYLVIRASLKLKTSNGIKVT